MLRRTISVLALAFVAVLGLASASHSYPAPTTGTGTVSAGTVTPGQPFTFSAGGFRAGSTVQVEVLGTRFSQSVTADAEGDVSARIALNETGIFTVRATGVNSAGETRVVNASVRVVATAGSTGSTAGSGSELPRTGSSGTATQVWAGLGLLGLGAGMVALTVARRRQGAGTIA